MDLSIESRGIYQLLKSGISFALYRLANEEDSYLIIDENPYKIYNILDLKSINYSNKFIIAPFKIDKTNPIILLDAKNIYDGIDIIKNKLTTIGFGANLPFINENNSDSIKDEYKEYSLVFDKFITEISKGKFSKLVLSRKSILEKDNIIDIFQAYHKAVSLYPNATISIFSNSDSLWLSASPEILIKKKSENIYQTVALAGTISDLNINNDDIIWTDKNKNEQAIVSDYIAKVLENRNIKYKISDTKTIKAGALYHLLNEFDLEIKESSIFFDILNDLHPTPAVLGFPKKEALTFISQNENYDREYYSGFIGPLEVSGKTALYVNLRSMKYDKKNVFLYAGGGLVQGSELDLEWNETINKMKTIKNII